MNYERLNVSRQIKDAVMDVPLVSVCCVTYNHAKFISKALNGFVSQDTKFQFEILVHEDASLDETADVLRLYEERYENIRVIYQKVNQFDNQNVLVDILFRMARGKYIALCEGDDYWTDPYKLQKQVDFLEAHSDFNLCFTRANKLKEGQFELFDIPNEQQYGIYYFDDLLYYHNFIPTATAMFRNEGLAFPPWFYKLPYGDLGIYLLVSQHKPIRCLSAVTGVYRVHDKGNWSLSDRITQIRGEIEFDRCIFEVLSAEQKDIVRRKAGVLYREWVELTSKQDILGRIKYHIKRIKLLLKMRLFFDTVWWTDVPKAIAGYSGGK